MRGQQRRSPSPALLLLLWCSITTFPSTVSGFVPRSCRSQLTTSSIQTPSHVFLKNQPKDDESDLVPKLEPQLSRASFLSLAAASASAALMSKPKPAEAKTLPRNSAPLDTTFLKSSQTLQESASGFVAGATLTLTKTFVKYPLDTATVRLQMPDTDYSIRNPLQLFNGCYRGVLAPLLWNVPGGAIFFSVKDATKSALRESGMPKWATTSLAVAAAQVPYWFVRNPSEVVKTRQQAGVAGYGEGVSAVEAFRLVIDESKQGNSTITGLQGLYAGYWENILYAYPADVIKFVCYDTITQGRKNLAPLEGAVAGAASTAVAQLLTTPLDVVRNRVMAGETSKDASPSYVDSLVTLGKEEGLTGLFAGASPRIGKAILSGAIQFATYEETKQKLNAFFQNR